MVVNIKMAGGALPGGHADGLKWACEPREEFMSSRGTEAGLFAVTIEMPVVEHSCRKDSQRDPGRR